MDDLPRALDEALLSDLECPVCMEYMVPPIKLCNNGHNICSKCRDQVDCCPTCRTKFTDIRNVALESIARRQKYPCANRGSGCFDLFSIEHIAEHQAVCTYGPIICPLNKTRSRCSWEGVICDLEEHAKTAHPRSIEKGATFISHMLKSAWALVYCFGEVFMYYKMFRDGRCYCAVQLIGPSSQASNFKCEFKLRAANEMEEIRNTFFVRSYSEDFETTFNSGKCLRLEDAKIRNFVLQAKLKLTVKIFRN
jgi:E3 ubiquitin-protein ligase SIAH1